jgi:hypothetical protein
MPLDQAEFTRRITRYLELDLPALESPEMVAQVLGERLWPYVAPKQLPTPDRECDADLLIQLFGPDPVALVFTARWDGNSTGYAALVRTIEDRVIEVDFDGGIAAGIANWAGIMITPAVVLVRAGSPTGRILGRRSADELRAWILDLRAG